LPEFFTGGYASLGDVLKNSKEFAKLNETFAQHHATWY
jgi:hypothetical protein